MKTLTEVLAEELEVRHGRVENWAKHIAAVYREARTITVDQLAELPDGTWIRDGRHDIGVKRDQPLDLAVRYPDRGDKINDRIPEPIHVLYIPGELS